MVPWLPLFCVNMCVNGKDGHITVSPFTRRVLEKESKQCHEMLSLCLRQCTFQTHIDAEQQTKQKSK